MNLSVGRRMAGFAAHFLALFFCCSSVPAAAQTMPSACDSKGALFFGTVGTYLVHEKFCAELVPTSASAFSRVLSRYEDEAPTCVAAARALPDLDLLWSEESTQSFVRDFKSGKLPPEQIRNLENVCLGIEEADSQARKSSEASRTLSPWPTP